MAGKQQTNEESKTERVVTRKQAEDYFSLYAANVGIGMSYFDIRLTIADTIDVDDAHAELEERVTLIFTPQHAKVFAAILAQNVRNYEAQFGELKIPAEMLGKSPKKELKAAETEKAK